MAPVSTSSKISPQYHHLEGGLVFCDKTGGVAKVFFDQEMAERCETNVYQFRIHDKEPVLFTGHDSTPFIGFRLVNSTSITIEVASDFFKITEVDPSGYHVYYVDRSTKRGMYHVFLHLPGSSMTETEARAKMAHLKNKHPSFEPRIIAYNRHGVGVFSVCQKSGRCFFFWAGPSDEKVRLVDCGDRLGYQGDSAFADTVDRSVIFRRQGLKDPWSGLLLACSINGELAQCIPK